MKTVRAIIKGRVQGVWFRAWTQGQANRLGVVGWVRNRTDGSVEAVFSGSKENVDAMVERCRKGPPLARVDSIDLTPDETPIAVGFEKLDTV